MKIKHVLLIPKDNEMLKMDESKDRLFIPPQAYDAGYGKWVLYNPYKRPPYGALHPFSLVLVWNGKPCMAGLDFFCRRTTGNAHGWEWPIMLKASPDKTAESIINKIKSWGQFEDSYGELVVIHEKEMNDHRYRWSSDGPECDLCGMMHDPETEPQDDEDEE